MCAEKKVDNFLDALIRKVLNPESGQRSGFENIDGHELDDTIYKWLGKKVHSHKLDEENPERSVYREKHVLRKCQVEVTVC